MNAQSAFSFRRRASNRTCCVAAMSTADPTGEGGGGGGGENAATTKVDRNASPSTPTTDTGGVPVQSSTVQQQHPPPSPLSGCYLLVVLPEPHTAQHKDLILNRLAKGKSVNDPSARTNRHSPIANWSARSLAFPLARRSLRCLPRWKVGGHARGCERDDPSARDDSFAERTTCRHGPREWMYRCPWLRVIGTHRRMRNRDYMRDW